MAVGNPFSGDAWARTGEVLLGERLDRLAAPLIEADRLGELEQLVLAVAHLQACDSPTDPSKVLSERTLPRSLARRLPRPTSAYLRLAMAAARCRQALLRMEGRSAGIAKVRREVWAACFGHTLGHALRLERVVRDHDVLILGETGTGKEAIARAIQDGTPGDLRGGEAARAAVNAAAIPETLLESALFGHVKGAFTGAIDSRQGNIRNADGGCFFLDEVGDLALATQVKLLRVMETDVVQPVGADATTQVDVRYVAATHVDLEARVREGTFRADLYHRLAGNVIRVPPLRERVDDIPLIGMAFVRRHLSTEDFQKERPAIERWLKSAAVRAHRFPGNVRELQNHLRDVMLGMSPRLDRETASASAEEPTDDIPARIREGAATMREVQDWYLRAALVAAEGNYTEVSRSLGIDRATVRRRARAMGL